jgi:nucleoid-associated protein YgaU
MTPRPTLKLAVILLALPLLYLGADSPTGTPTLVPSAQALVGLPFTPLSFAGVARRTTRRVVAVDATMATSAAAAAGVQQQAVAQQQAATAQQQAATAQQQQAVAQQQAAVAAQQSGRPAVGTVVQALPGGCTSSPRGGVEYYDCGGVFYRAAFQGSNLVYVVQNP